MTLPYIFEWLAELHYVVGLDVAETIINPSSWEEFPNMDDAGVALILAPVREWTFCKQYADERFGESQMNMKD